MMWYDNELEWLNKYGEGLNKCSLRDIPQYVKINSADYWFKVKLYLAIAFIRKLDIKLKDLGYIKSIVIDFGGELQAIAAGNILDAPQYLSEVIGKLGLPKEIRFLYKGEEFDGI